MIERHSSTAQDEAKPRHKRGGAPDISKRTGKRLTAGPSKPTGVGSSRHLCLSNLQDSRKRGKPPNARYSAPKGSTTALSSGLRRQLGSSWEFWWPPARCRGMGPESNRGEREQGIFASILTTHGALQISSTAERLQLPTLCVSMRPLTGKAIQPTSIGRSGCSEVHFFFSLGDSSALVGQGYPRNWGALNSIMVGSAHTSITTETASRSSRRSSSGHATQ